MKTLEWISSEIKARRIQVCNDYPNFFRTVASIANEYGEAGRDYARMICMESNNYSDKAFDYQFNYCLKHRYARITAGTLYYLCQQAGLNMKQLYDANLWKQWEFDFRNQDRIIRNAEQDYFKLLLSAKL